MRITTGETWKLNYARRRCKIMNDGFSFAYFLIVQFTLYHLGVFP